MPFAESARTPPAEAIRSSPANRPAAVGFDRIIIRPRAPGDLTWVRAHHDTVLGRIASAWKREAGSFTLNVTVPVNSSALVDVPARDADSVTESGKPSRNAQGVRFIRMEEGVAVYRVGSGSYTFVSRGAT